MQNQTNLISKEKTQKQNRVWVRISAACNNLCIFCLDSDAQNGKLIPEDIVKKQIAEGYKPWYENRIILSWGEASINPKFPEYIKFAREIWYDRVQTVTNGNMFAFESFCQKVFDAGLQEVTFSFHGHNSLLHDYLVATPGAFKKSLKWLVYIKKNYPHIIINIDIVVNKINVKFLPDIVKFFMKLWVYEFDILQIIPFGRGFSEHKDKLFYSIEENISSLQETWKLSRIPWMYMWTNRFPVEAFENYEDLIQDPRKIKSETMGESYEMFAPFIQSKGQKKLSCFGEACQYCFLHQYCHDFLRNTPALEVKKWWPSVLSGEEFPSQVLEKYGEKKDFLNFLQENQVTPWLNVPRCLGGSGIFQSYNDLSPEYSVEDYTKKYIQQLYRKKSISCKKCIHNQDCEWIHINFIRTYGFDILSPIV